MLVKDLLVGLSKYHPDAEVSFSDGEEYFPIAIRLFVPHDEDHVVLVTKAAFTFPAIKAN
jgi:hypothetical protein